MPDRTKPPYVDQTKAGSGPWKLVRTSPAPHRCQGRFNNRPEAEEAAKRLSEAKGEKWEATRL